MWLAAELWPKCFILARVPVAATATAAAEMAADAEGGKVAAAATVAAVTPEDDPKGFKTIFSSTIVLLL